MLFNPCGCFKLDIIERFISYGAKEIRPDIAVFPQLFSVYPELDERLLDDFIADKAGFGKLKGMVSQLCDIHIIEALKSIHIILFQESSNKLTLIDFICNFFFVHQLTVSKTFKIQGNY